MNSMILLLSLFCLTGRTPAPDMQFCIDFSKHCKVAKHYGLWRGVLITQAAYESGFGKSDMARYSNNYFGMIGMKFKSPSACVKARCQLNHKPIYRASLKHLKRSRKGNSKAVYRYFKELAKHYAPNSPEGYARTLQAMYRKYGRGFDR